MSISLVRVKCVFVRHDEFTFTNLPEEQITLADNCCSSEFSLYSHGSQPPTTLQLLHVVEESYLKHS